MQRELRIGEIAARSGRSVHTIRWYEAQGLLPGVVRDAAGRRVYGAHHVGWLDLMERLRLTGMSIREMREYTTLARQGTAALTQRRALLGRNQRRVRDSIARWTEALALINAKVEFYDEWMANGERPTVAPHQRVPQAMRALKTDLRA
ncbi:MerR family transcriptional regulator [Bradyrhizobium sp. NP1]|uniref:MerR family transcriptional regulator n=1 Tax=Bradyrhizobium sp. NP1 TaxID=3049772 RepID=UPI0025A68B81|nr:MerR family transcriptional regulator [Bradyrhizobium sp. NP1]WJR77823.1 MerR family transcriptional regulator [Bradyrhizobium sp. NP1]